MHSVEPVVSAKPTRVARVADRLVQVLHQLGVRHAFGLPGGAISPVFDALLDSSIDLTVTRHENTAVFAAAGYARQSQGPAAVLVTSGPGVLNCTAALASAKTDGLPVVVLAGEVSRAQQGRAVLQDGSAHGLDVRAVLRSLCKLVLEVPSPECATSYLRKAVGTSMEGRRGPVVVLLPVDILQVLLPRADVQDPWGHAAGEGPSDRQLQRVMQAIGDRRDIALLAGSGCRWGEGPALLERLAGLLAVPVVTTPKAKGVLRESHPWHRGVLGIGGHSGADAVFSAPVRTLLAFGTSLGDLATHGWWANLRPTQDFVHVDIDELQFGRTFPATVPIVSAFERFARRLIPLLSAAPTTAPTPALERSLGPPQPHHRAPEQLGQRLHPGRAVLGIQALMPADTVYTVDSGEHCFFALHYLQIEAPDAFVCMLGLGSMGSGICGALGVKLAQPDRPVACICGDGGMLMYLGEVSTAVEQGLDVVWFVFHDGVYGMVQHGHHALYARSPDFALGPVDFADAARALGATGFTVRTRRELQQLDLAAVTGPVVVDVHIDGTVQMPKGGRLSVLGEMENTL